MQGALKVGPGFASRQLPRGLPGDCLCRVPSDAAPLADLASLGTELPDFPGIRTSLVLVLTSLGSTF